MLNDVHVPDCIAVHIEGPRNPIRVQDRELSAFVSLSKLPATSAVFRVGVHWIHRPFASPALSNRVTNPVGFSTCLQE